MTVISLIVITAPSGAPPKPKTSISFGASSSLDNFAFSILNTKSPAGITSWLAKKKFSSSPSYVNLTIIPGNLTVELIFTEKSTVSSTVAERSV